MAQPGYVEGPPQHTQANLTAENPHASPQAMTWDETATFDKSGMPKSEADRLTWLQNSEIDQRAWDALIADPVLFKVVYDLATR